MNQVIDAADNTSRRLCSLIDLTKGNELRGKSIAGETKVRGHEVSEHTMGRTIFPAQRNTLWYENVLVVLLAVAAGLVFLDRLGIVYVFRQIQQELHLNHAELGMLMGVTSLTWALSSISVSFLSDGLGIRPKLIIVACLVGFSCATGLIAVTHTYGGLLAVRAAAGMFFGPAIPLMLAVAAKSSSPHRLGANVGAVGAGMVLLGNAVSPGLVTVLAREFGWHLAFLYLALPGLVLAAILAFYIRQPVSLGADRPAAERVGLKDLLALLLNRNLALAIIGGLALISFLITFPSFSPLFLGQDRTISVTMRTALLTLMGLSSGIGNFFVPMLSDHFRRKTCALIASLCIILVPLTLALLRGHHALTPLVLIVQFIAGGAMPMVVFVIPGESVPRRVAATAFALPLAIGELVGGSTTPGIAGLLSDHYGLMSVMWFCSGLGVICLLSVVAMREPPRRAGSGRHSAHVPA